MFRELEFSMFCGEEEMRGPSRGGNIGRQGGRR